MFIFQLTVACWKHCIFAALPDWVKRVDECPDPKNIDQWIEGSKRIGCKNNLTSINPNEQKDVYHCLPSSYLNETVEFCGRSSPVAPGILSFSLINIVIILFVVNNIFIDILYFH